MGLAILWVMFCHSHIDVSSSNFLSAIKWSGPMGVDIFMFVSGFGIYYSLSKNSSLKTYYKNRILRIIPYYTPIVLLYSLFQYSQNIWGVDTVIKNVLTINYWLGADYSHIFDWYVPAIIVIYALSPLFYKFFKKKKNLTTIVTIGIFYIINFFIIGTKYTYLGLVVMRVPIYIAGFWIADYVKNNQNTKLSLLQKTIAILALIAGFSFIAYLGIFHQDSYVIYFLYGIGLAVIPFCLIYSYLFSLLPKFKFPILTLCGTYSLTLYIFHERVLNILTLNNIIEYKDIIAFIITFALAISWPKFVDFILAKTIQPKVYSA